MTSWFSGLTGLFVLLELSAPAAHAGVGFLISRWGLGRRLERVIRSICDDGHWQVKLLERMVQELACICGFVLYFLGVLRPLNCLLLFPNWDGSRRKEVVLRGPLYCGRARIHRRSAVEMNGSSNGRIGFVVEVENRGLRGLLRCFEAAPKMNRLHF